MTVAGSPSHCNCTHVCDGDAPVPRGPGIRKGDVYKIEESIYTPIYDILSHESSNPDRATWRDSRQTFHDIVQKMHATYKRRPCIMMKHDPDPPTVRKGRKLCLTTTLEGERIENLPRIFLEFCVPIAPSYAISGDEAAHVHSLPEWDRENAWVIAWMFTSRRALLGDSPDPNCVTRQERVFGSKAMNDLKDECQKRLRAWYDKCRNDQSVSRLYKAECKQHWADRIAQKEINAGKMASGLSLASSCTVGSRRQSWRRDRSLRMGAVRRSDVQQWHKRTSGCSLYSASNASLA
ncbi:hypothetical protein C8Q76DRAFT_853153 [Earliella scabrosa]|nr:hypothetical protein C8Q76DRAFT_853153 [Earliella scabrosa]